MNLPRFFKTRPYVASGLAAGVGFAIYRGVKYLVDRHEWKTFNMAGTGSSLGDVEPDPSPAPALDPGASTGGLLAAAVSSGSFDPIRWVDVPCPALGGLIVTIASQPLSATMGDRRGVFLPLSYAEQVAMYAANGWIPGTKEMYDAAFAASGKQTTLVSLVQSADDSAKMGTVGFTTKFNDAIQAQFDKIGKEPGDLTVGGWKVWILSPRLAERNDVTTGLPHLWELDSNACNYGFWNLALRPPAPVQSPGMKHDNAHWDYSQVAQPIQRMAKTADGTSVDLCDWIANNANVPEQFITPYRAGSNQA